MPNAATVQRPSNKMDMLHGSLWNKILLFALPLAAGGMMQQLFNAADAAVVGQFVGSEALAAVGSNVSLIGLFINMFMGLSGGANVIIALYIGQGEPAKVSRAVHTTMLVAVISGVSLLAAGVSFAPKMLEIMNSPEDVIDLATLYLRIYFLGMPFAMVYNFGAAILRSIGDTRRPLCILTAAGVINVALNLMLVVWFQMSVAGVAIATVVSQMASAAAVVFFLLREGEPITLRTRELAIHKTELIHMLRIGIPAGLQGMMFSISNATIQSTVNTFGASAVAGSSASLYLEIINFFLLNGFVQAAMTFTSQNFGAQKFDRCRRVFKITMIYGMVIPELLGLILFFGRRFFIGLYTSDEQVMSFAFVRLAVTVLPIFMSFYEVIAATIRGLGRSLTPAVIILCGTCLFRLFWVFAVISRVHDYLTLLIVYPISWTITCAIMGTAYIVITKKLYKRDEVSPDIV